MCSYSYRLHRHITTSKLQTQVIKLVVLSFDLLVVVVCRWSLFVVRSNTTKKNFHFYTTTTTKKAIFTYNK